MTQQIDRAAQGRAALFKNLRDMRPDDDSLKIIESVENSAASKPSQQTGRWKPRRGVRQN